MTEPSYFILASLLGEKRHGYAIIKEAERLSDGRVLLSAGTLYGALERLRKQGLIATAGQEIVDGRTRRYYTLTPDGERELRAEAERMRRASRAVPRTAPRGAAT